MEQNNMTSFQYKVDESSGALPIDYSQQAATPKLDCSRPTIDKFITSNPLSSKLFSWIRYNGEEDELVVLHKQQPAYL